MDEDIKHKAKENDSLKNQIADFLIDNFNQSQEDNKKTPRYIKHQQKRQDDEEDVVNDESLPFEFEVDKTERTNTRRKQEEEKKEAIKGFFSKFITKSRGGHDAEGDILTKICSSKYAHVKRQKEIISADKLLESISLVAKPRGFISAINAKISCGENALIAEIKKASPSKGVIRDNFYPEKIAKDYALGGAACISVLTDYPYFKGRDEYINIVHRACNLPILRKDFILDPYQVIESRAIGADCILLIMAALDLDKALELEDLALKLDMDVLVEVHNEYELKQALKLKTSFIGINNRNLKTMEIDLKNTKRLAPKVGNGKIIVCESGIYKNEDILAMNKYGVNTFLVGEALMKEDDILRATQSLLGYSF